MRLRRTAAAGVLSTAVFSALFIGTAQAADDKNCSDFATQAQAQAFFDATPGDPSNLDSDGDQIACESLPGSGTASAVSEDGTVTGSAQVAARPSGAVAAGDGSASGDSSVLPYVLGGVALTAAGGAAVAARRSSRVTA